MKRPSIALVTLLLLLPLMVQPKRLPPPVVEPVYYEGVRYVAPNDDGRNGYVEAYDEATGNKKWKKVIFKNCIKPLLEEDVQWVFIRSLSVHEGKLLLTDERDKKYVLDLKTLKVKKLKS